MSFYRPCQTTAYVRCSRTLLTKLQAHRPLLPTPFATSTKSLSPSLVAVESPGAGIGAAEDPRQSTDPRTHSHGSRGGSGSGEQQEREHFRGRAAETRMGDDSPGQLRRSGWFRRRRGVPIFRCGFLHYRREPASGRRTHSGNLGREWTRIKVSADQSFRPMDLA